MLFIKSFANLSIFFVILLSGAITGGYRFLKYDEGDSIKTQIQEINVNKDQTQAKIANLKLELKALQETDILVNKMGDEINNFLRFIPSRLTSAMILNHLNNTAKSTGVNVENITNYDFVRKEEFYEKLKVSVTIKGIFSNVLLFLSKLTGLTEMITVESFAMDSVRGRADVSVHGLEEVKVRMDIFGYRYASPVVDLEAN